MKNLRKEFISKKERCEKELKKALKNIDEYNISEKSSEIEWLRGRIDMLEQCIFFIEEEVWEEEMPFLVSHI